MGVRVTKTENYALTAPICTFKYIASFFDTTCTLVAVEKKKNVNYMGCAI